MSINVFIIILILLFNTSYTSILGNQRYNNFCLAAAAADVDGEDEDFLAEILAEQAREEEELAKLEAEAREFDAMKARQPSGGSAAAGGYRNHYRDGGGGGSDRRGSQYGGSQAGSMRGSYATPSQVRASAAAMAGMGGGYNHVASRYSGGSNKYGAYRAQGGGSGSHGGGGDGRARPFR